MSKTMMKRLERLEQTAGETKAARILVVAEASEVPAAIDPRTLVVRTGVPRSSNGVA
jgi:hypothetical protein